MMRWNSFTGTLVFGALAAVALPAVWLGLGPRYGVWDTISVYLVAVAGIHTVGLARDVRSAVGVAFGSVLVGGFVVFVARDWIDLAVGGGLSLAVFRSIATGAVRRPIRALCIESMLGLAGLGLAGMLASPGPVGVALALWGYFLVQSIFHLVGPGGGIGRERGALDPFDHARRQLLELLDEG